jgi:hypothetical protein
VTRRAILTVQFTMVEAIGRLPAKPLIQLHPAYRTVQQRHLFYTV